MTAYCLVCREFPIHPVTGACAVCSPTAGALAATRARDVVAILDAADRAGALPALQDPGLSRWET